MQLEKIFKKIIIPLKNILLLKFDDLILKPDKVIKLSQNLIQTSLKLNH